MVYTNLTGKLINQRWCDRQIESLFFDHNFQLLGVRVSWFYRTFVAGLAMSISRIDILVLEQPLVLPNLRSINFENWVCGASRVRWTAWAVAFVTSFRKWQLLLKLISIDAQTCDLEQKTPIVDFLTRLKSIEDELGPALLVQHLPVILWAGVVSVSLIYDKVLGVVCCNTLAGKQRCLVEKSRNTMKFNHPHNILLLRQPTNCCFKLSVLKYPLWATRPPTAAPATVQECCDDLAPEIPAVTQSKALPGFDLLVECIFGFSLGHRFFGSFSQTLLALVTIQRVHHSLLLEEPVAACQNDLGSCESREGQAAEAGNEFEEKLAVVGLLLAFQCWNKRDCGIGILIVRQQRLMIEAELHHNGTADVLWEVVEEEDVVESAELCVKLQLDLRPFLLDVYCGVVELAKLLHRARFVVHVRVEVRQ